MNGVNASLHFAKAAIRCASSWPTSPRFALFFGEASFSLLGLRRKREQIEFSQIKTVVVVRLDEIGDVVMTTAFLRELRRNLSDAWISLVVKPEVFNLVEISPHVNEILTYDWKVKGRFVNLRRHWRLYKLAYRSLWRRRFDLAILPRWDADLYHGTFLLYFSGAHRRIGYSENVSPHKKSVNKHLDRLLTHLLKDSSPKHEVQRNLDLIRFLGGKIQDERLELWINEDDKAFAKRFFKDHGAEPRHPIIALSPGAGAPKRLWPIERFAQLGAWLQQEYAARLLVVGGPGEETLGMELERALRTTVFNAVGRTTLRQTAALLRECRLLIGNDAGPMHIAAAVGVPVVALSCHPESGSLWSANSPLRFRPWGQGHIVVQPKKPRDPCALECVATRPHCILGITVDRVKEAAAKNLNAFVETTSQTLEDNLTKGGLLIA